VRTWSVGDERVIGFEVVVRAMGCSFGWTATVAAFMATKAGGRDGPAPGAKRPSGGGWRRPAILLRDGKAAQPPPRKIVGRRHCRAGPFVGRSPSRRPGRGPLRWGKQHPMRMNRMRTPARSRLPVRLCRQNHEAATSSGASCTRISARSASMPRRRRSSLKSPSMATA
jgi:hypothetical protein